MFQSSAATPLPRSARSVGMNSGDEKTFGSEGVSNAHDHGLVDDQRSDPRRRALDAFHESPAVGVRGNGSGPSRATILSRILDRADGAHIRAGEVECRDVRGHAHPDCTYDGRY